MHRRDFIRTSCSACFAVTVFSSVSSSCASVRIIPGSLGKDGVIISKDEFVINRKGGLAYSAFIIVRNEALKYPICVYRFSEVEYSAIWLRCSHQGTELQVAGNALQCPAHGSEFNNRGEVTNGPAGTNLRTFPVVVSATGLFIDLRKPA